MAPNTHKECAPTNTQEINLNTYYISPRVYACEHPSFVPIPGSKWVPKYNNILRYPTKCAHCLFSPLTDRFHKFSNPATPFNPAEFTLLAFDLFDARQCLSAGETNVLMRYLIGGLERHEHSADKQLALCGAVVESVQENDGELAASEMQDMLALGRAKFISKRRSEIPVHVHVSDFARPTNASSRRSSLCMTPSSPTSPSIPGVRRAGSVRAKGRSPLGRPPTVPEEGLGESSDGSKSQEPVRMKESNVVLALERLYSTMRALDYHEAEDDVWAYWYEGLGEKVHGLCDQLEAQAKKTKAK